MVTKKFLDRWLEVPSIDPEDLRRRKLLNILLLGLMLLAVLLFIASIVVSIIDPSFSSSDLSIAAIVALFGLATVYCINRYGSGEIASFLFTLFLILLTTIADEPQQIVEGRSLFIFMIPIFMASFILRPWASFIAAGVSGVFITLIAITQLGAFAPPIPTILGFFAVALVSWLSSRSLETALIDLRTLNEELDQRVQIRTRELRQANDELTLAYEKLKELDRLKSRFVSMVSHELRTPLSAIQGFTEMIMTGVYGPLSEGQRKALERVQINDRRLLSLVNDLLDQARMEAGQLSLHITQFELQTLIHEMESTMRVLAEGKGLYLKTIVEENIPKTLQGDAKRLHQILVNLINNALKFTEEGGVTVRFYAPNPDHWGMDIIDTGPGIPSSALGYIFEPFRQVDSSATREHKGFGLGLAIVKQLVELMGGYINVSSTVGKGSKFSILLPRVPVQTQVTPDNEGSPLENNSKIPSETLPPPAKEDA